MMIGHNILFIIYVVSFSIISKNNSYLDNRFVLIKNNISLAKWITKKNCTEIRIKNSQCINTRQKNLKQ